MKIKLLFIGMLLWGVSMLGQTAKEFLKTDEVSDLSRLTVGLGVGVNHLFKDVNDYYLTTDGTHNLKMDNLNKTNFVLSQIVVFRLGVDRAQRNAEKKYNNLYKKYADSSRLLTPFKNFKWEQFSILLSLNLLDLQTNEVGFNKNIDGGLGIGYAIANNLQLGVLYEFKHYRQLRPFILDKYLDKPIPNGATESYTTLDKTDNNLFYDKTLEGLSVKLIFNITTF